MKRDESIDIARAIGMLLVIINHFWQTNPLGGGISSFHMPLLMFISGICFRPCDMSLRAQKTFKRAGAPYVLTWALCTVFWAAVYFWKDILSFQYLKDSLVSFFIADGVGIDDIKGVGVIWFLASLIFAQIVFNAIENTRWKIRSKMLLIIVMFVLCEIIRRFIILPNWIALGGVRFLFWLALGYYYKKYIAANTDISNAKKHTVLMVFIALWIIQLIAQYTGYGLYKFGAFAPILITLWLGRKLTTVKYLNTLLKWIGQNTMKIMCIHSFGIECVNSFWVKIDYYKVDTPTMMLIRLVGTILAAYFLDILIKQFRRRKKDGFAVS